MGNQHVARRASIGIGIESVPGTTVAPTDWTKQMKLSLERMTEVAENKSAVGRVEDTLDSAIVQKWSEGSLEGLVGDTTIGYLLYALLGTKAVAANADASGTIKDHTFDVAQTNTPPTLTFARKDPITDRRHGMGTVESLDIDVKPAEYVSFSSAIKALFGGTATNTVAYGTDNYFTSKHATVKIASNVAGLAGATAPKLKSFKMSIKNPATPFVPLGGVDPTVITSSVVSVEGEMVLQYEDTTYETLWENNTVQAMSLTLLNTDITIGTSANPKIAITLPKVRFRPFSKSDDLDGIVEQTLSFKAELDLSAGYLVRVVVTNAKASY